MGHMFGSADWAAALEQEINGSSEYRNAASKWGVGFNGNVMLAFGADDTLTDSLNLLVRLEGGQCAGAEFVTDAQHPDAGFTLRAPFRLWKEILERKTLAATAILKGSLKVDGDKMTLLRHTAANRALVHCAASVETNWA